jgi:small subunit ribosomal protein S20
MLTVGRHITAPQKYHSQETQLANSPQARKRSRQSENRRKQNASQRSMVRTYIKRVNAAIANGEQPAAKKALDEAVPVIDGMVSKGVMHKNKAARHKSRLNAHVKSLAG